MQDIIVPPLNKESAEIVHKNWQAVDEVPYQLGKVEKMVEKYAAICGTPDFEGKIKSAMLLMCGDHGIAKYGVSAYPQEVTMQMINGYMRGTAGANVMARHAGADVFVVDMGTTFDLSHLPKVRNEKVAWGTEDYKVLNTGCERHKIENPVQYEDYLDLAEAYKLWKGDELTTGLKRATEEQEVDTAGLWHTAYDDAANTGKLLVRMLEKGWTPELYFEQKAAYDAEKAERRLHGR